MALLHLDGFTAYAAAADLDNRYTRVGGAPNLQLVPGGGPSGNGALELGGVDTSWAGIEFTHGSLLQNYSMGFWFEYLDFDATDDQHDAIVTFQSTTSVRYSLRLMQDGSLRLYRSTNSTLFWDSADTDDTPDGEAHYLFAGQQYKIEMTFDSQNTVGSFYLWVNGEQWAAFSGDIDLDGTCNRFCFHTGLEGSGARYRVADWYLLDSTGSVNTSRLGESWKVEIRRPDADSATESDFTPATGTDNFAMVDDGNPSDEDASYNQSTGNAEIDRFTDATPVSQLKVHGVQVVTRARHTGSAQDMRNTIFENATAGNGADVALSDSYEPYHTLFETNPDTSAQWTPAEVEAAEFGYESRA